MFFSLDFSSCFANVVLQCLTYTKPLVAFLLEKGHRKECKITIPLFKVLRLKFFVRKSMIFHIIFFFITGRRNEWCFFCEFQTHIERVSQSSQPFSPINILSRLPNIGGTLGYGKQEDAHEFMRYLPLEDDQIV